MTKHPLDPLFLISLPRAGSTLVQRILAAHPVIYSTAEPWLLLPFFHALRTSEIYADFDFATYKRAIAEFCAELPGGEDEYRREIAEAARRLYARVSPNNTEFFLDKTPRYTLILHDLLTAFPDAKFIILWRNPLAIAASMIESFSNGRWNLHSYRIDLFQGLANVCDAYQKHPDRFHVVNYEGLVADPQTHTEEMFNHLGIPNVAEAYKSFADVQFKGKMGDRTGRVNYSSVSTQSLEKWQHTFSNPLRKRWARDYLKWLGPERLTLMGYDIDELGAQVDAIPISGAHLVQDVPRMIYGRVEPYLNLNVFRSRVGRLAGTQRSVSLR